MKAPPFRYCRPETIEEALELLARYGDDASVIAGGQSLLPALALRLSAPAVLVDVSRINELHGIQEIPSGLRIGAMSRHKQVEHSPLVATYAPLLAAAMRLVAHPPIRAMGTFGGSVALADPAAEAPAATLAHEAELVMRTLEGEQRIHADDFFQGVYTTALPLGAILVAAEFQRPGAGGRFVFRELARRSGDFATVGVAARAAIEGSRVTSARIVVFGVVDRPAVAANVARSLIGRDLSDLSIDAALAAIDSDVTPLADLHHDETTKMRLLRVLLKRVLKELHEGDRND
jgi:aerobic carbon-monoxide dehydrogenase medium subunit